MLVKRTYIYYGELNALYALGKLKVTDYLSRISTVLETMKEGVFNSNVQFLTSEISLGEGFGSMLAQLGLFEMNESLKSKIQSYMGPTYFPKFEILMKLPYEEKNKKMINLLATWGTEYYAHM